MNEDDFIRVEAHECPMSTCSAPAGSPCRTGKGRVAVQYHTARFRLAPSLAKALNVPTPAVRKPGSAWVELPRPTSAGAEPAGHPRMHGSAAAPETDDVLAVRAVMDTPKVHSTPDKLDKEVSLLCDRLGRTVDLMLQVGRGSGDNPSPGTSSTGAELLIVDEADRRRPPRRHGQLDAFLLLGAGPWDIAALIPIIQEAGGTFSDLAGRQRTDTGAALFARASLHQQLLDVIATGIWRGSCQPAAEHRAAS